MIDDNNNIELMDEEVIEIEDDLPLTEIPDGSITTPKLADKAVTPEKLDRKYLTEQIQSDLAQNDPTKPDYVKNRLAYYGRKFDDIHAVEYTPQIVVSATVPGGTQPLRLMKIAELPENVTPNEFLKELNGFKGTAGEIDFRKPETYQSELCSYKEFTNEEGQVVGTAFCKGFDGQHVPFLLATNTNGASFSFDYSEEHFTLNCPESGIYSITWGGETNDNGEIIKYTPAFDLIEFREAQPFDMDLLPLELLRYIRQENQKINNKIVSDWDDLKHKPFCIEGKYRDDVTFDGVVDENSVVSSSVKPVPTQETFYVKVCDLPCSSHEYLSQISKASGVFADYEVQYSSESFAITSEGVSDAEGSILGVIEQNSATYAVIAIDTITGESACIGDFTFPEPGVYLYYVKFANGASVYIDRLVFEKIKSLDEQFMPKGYKELKQTVLMMNLDGTACLPTPGVEGAFLRTVNGKWTASVVPSFEEAEF